MLSKQEEEQERRETLENDRLVREAEHQRLLRGGTTFHQFAQSFADEVNQGRFAATGVPVETQMSGNRVSSAVIGLIAGGKDFAIVTNMCARYGLDPRNAS
jgi:hypothetical protein